MPFVFPNFIMAATPHVKCDRGSGWEKSENGLYQKMGQMGTC